MSKKISWMITDNNITVNYEGQTHIVPRTDSLSNRLIKAIKENKMDEIPSLVSAAKRIELFSEGHFFVQDDKILINGVEAPTALGNKIVKFSNEGLPYQPLIKFAEKLQQNPSYRAVQELFQFLEKNDHPITENGCFIAYKRVREDFKDIYTGTMDNSVGNVVSMPRNQVNEDSAQTCSHGLHVANWSYAHTQYGSNTRDTDVMLEVEVDPADVVAIPTDYNQSKMRVCKYTVLGVIDKEHSSDVRIRYTSSVCEQSCDCDQDEEEEEEEELEYDLCDECGCEVDIGCTLCTDCENLTCDECGDYTYDGSTLCEDCADEDCYPWEEELD